ncbi:MAG: SufD family Fe-S cluster assembly protein [Acholeplasmatales bacterium]|jgi:Fe-S cluster assembly protein SufD|nr:SufD family Fe-S cluster assembly protein [Acholeplasmatales bacterium]
MAKKYLSQDSLIHLNKNSHFFISDDTKLRIVVLVKTDNQNSELKIFLESRVDLELLIITQENFHINVSINMIGDHSRLLVNNLGLLKRNSSSSKNIIIRHRGFYNYSRIESFNLLDEKSSLEEYANVIIEKKTAFSDTYLKQRALILDEKSSATLMPTLEINNSETKAGHGCVQGYFNPELIFYLMSRGLSKDHAQKILIDSYINPLVSNFSDIYLWEKLYNV